MGWAIAIGVTLHKLADGASLAGLMLGTQHSTRVTTAILIVTAIAPIFGVWLQGYVALATPQLALLLGWFAGVFLYLGAGSLLPAAHDASHSRLLPLATLAWQLLPELPLFMVPSCSRIIDHPLAPVPVPPAQPLQPRSSLEFRHPNSRPHA